MSSQSSFATQNSRCAQIYTLQGDINKDLRMWHEAIQVRHTLPRAALTETRSDVCFF